jgi:methylated-DNA-[protein]-cysteine S-methyltransferase
VTATAVIETPMGPFSVTADAHAVTAASWLRRGAVPLALREPDVLEAAIRELTEYFSGDRDAFDVPVDLSGLGAFQRRVLDATCAIPYGETRSYGQLAAELGDPGTVRAVGGALKYNPVAVIVPCHRVIAAGGSLPGYGGAPNAGGRLDLKRALLELERGELQQTLF